jgi:hypothetical protein
LLQSFHLTIGLIASNVEELLSVKIARPKPVNPAIIPPTNCTFIFAIPIGNLSFPFAISPIVTAGFKLTEIYLKT